MFKRSWFFRTKTKAPARPRGEHIAEWVKLVAPTRMLKVVAETTYKDIYVEQNLVLSTKQVFWRDHLVFKELLGSVVRYNYGKAWVEQLRELANDALLQAEAEAAAAFADLEDEPNV